MQLEIIIVGALSALSSIIVAAIGQGLLKSSKQSNAELIAAVKSMTDQVASLQRNDAMQTKAIGDLQASEAFLTASVNRLISGLEDVFNRLAKLAQPDNN